MTTADIWNLYERGKSAEILNWNRAELARKHLALDSTRVDRLPVQIPVAIKRLRDAGYSDGTIRRDIQVLNAALRWSHLQSVRGPAEPPRREVFTTWDNLQKLISISSRYPVWMRTFVRLLVYTGQRKGAVLGLRWSDVDFNRNTIDFRASMVARQKGRAIVPIHRDLAPYLRAISSSFSLVLENPVVSERRLRVVDYTWMKMAKEAGLPEITPHAVRHSVATHLVESGADLLKVSRLLGHSNVAITQKVYAHFSPNFVDEAMEMMK